MNNLDQSAKTDEAVAQSSQLQNDAGTLDQQKFKKAEHSQDAQLFVSDISYDQKMNIVGQVLTDLLPYVASHGGHVELVDIKNDIVFIRFSGTCVSCPLSFYTVTYGIERHIKVKLPSVQRVEVVED